jgi:DNA-binding MarR family transcriptional regulator
MSPEALLSQVLHDWTEIYMRRSFREFKQFMDEHGLSPSQAGTLMRLHHCGADGVSDIGEHLGISAPAASQMVERLVQGGLLERREDPQDRRYKHIALTLHGNALIASGIAARRQWLEQVTAELSPEEQQTVARALTLLVNAARKLEGEPARSLSRPEPGER